MATALSGTGPAYVFLFMEAMVDAGVHLGFPRRIAEQLVVQTLKGSVAYYESSPSHLARLRNQVTSPAGTTAAALYYLEKAGFRPALSRAIWAAYERSVQLGRRARSGRPCGGRLSPAIVNDFTKRSGSVIIRRFIPEAHEGSGAQPARAGPSGHGLHVAASAPARSV